MIDAIFPLISLIFAAGFGGGYLVRHQISRKRHREAAQRRMALYGYGSR